MRLAVLSDSDALPALRLLWNTGRPVAVVANSFRLAKKVVASFAKEVELQVRQEVGHTVAWDSCNKKLVAIPTCHLSRLFNREQYDVLIVDALSLSPNDLLGLRPPCVT